nr:HSP70 family protein [Streptococcus thermophilus]
MISEPRAAAIHYAAQQQVAEGQHVAVFDFGGGTLDIAVLRAERDGDYRVVAAKGDNSLGGRTIDNLVFRWVVDQIDHDDPGLADSLRSAPASVMNALQENIREAKEMLSDTSSATVTISSPSGERDVLITRDEFNRVISAPIGRAAEMTRAVLGEAGVRSSDTPIYLTGGSSRIPFVQDELGRVGRVMRLDDPKTVVCRGALVATLRGFTQPVQGGGQRFVAAGANPFGGPAQPPQAAQPMAQAAQTQPAQPGAHSAGQSSVPSSGAGGNKGGKGPLIVAGALGAVALLGIGGWAVTRGGDNTDGSNEASSTAPSVSESETPGYESAASSAARTSPTSTTSSSASPGSKFVPIGEITGDDSFLPEQFRNSLSPCDTEEHEADGIVYNKWIEDTSVKYYRCSQEGNNFGISFFKDVNADQAFEVVEKLPPENGSELSGGNPKVRTATDTANSPVRDVVIYYPNEKLLISSLVREDDEGARRWATDNGFM